MTATTRQGAIMAVRRTEMAESDIILVVADMPPAGYEARELGR